MPMIHDPAVRASLEKRLDALRPDSPRLWGSMTPAQMLWHVNQFLGASLGEVQLPASGSPLPAPVMRFMLIHLPWPKGAPTNPGALAKEQYDFEAERKRCHDLIGRMVQKPVDSAWPNHPNFGKSTGAFASKLQARHLDHHFRQFGA